MAVTLTLTLTLTSLYTSYARTNDFFFILFCFLRCKYNFHILKTAYFDITSFCVIKNVKCAAFRGGDWKTLCSRLTLARSRNVLNFCCWSESLLRDRGGSLKSSNCDWTCSMSLSHWSEGKPRGRHDMLSKCRTKRERSSLERGFPSGKVGNTEALNVSTLQFLTEGIKTTYKHMKQVSFLLFLTTFKICLFWLFIVFFCCSSYSF